MDLKYQTLRAKYARLLGEFQGMMAGMNVQLPEGHLKDATEFYLNKLKKLEEEFTNESKEE